MILVAARDVEAAHEELASYEAENAHWPPRETPLQAAPGGKHGTAAFVFVTVVFYALSMAAAPGAFGMSWKAAGIADAELIMQGELWRVVTALFLHSGPVHVLNNLFFGVLFGYSAAYVLGGGVAWFAILLAGALGNLTNAWVQSADHVSLGASTAVFAAVGLLGGSEWRRRKLLRQRRLRVAAPFVMALSILAFHGVPEVPGRVDVMAHVFGFFWGIGLGLFAAWLLEVGSPRRASASSESGETTDAPPLRAQRVAATLAILLIVGAWTIALTRYG